METVSEQPELVIIQGPTASGKSDLAVRLAERFSGEVINADSMQVYRGMDIGTAKPSLEMRERIAHHLLDMVDPDQPFSAADFRREAERAVLEIHGRGKKVFIVGGTGLYIKALTKGLIDSPGGNEALREEMKETARHLGNLELYERLFRVDPDTANKLHPNDLVRIIRALEVYEMTGRSISELRDRHRFSDNRGSRCLKLGIMMDRPELYRRIEERVDRMMELGLAGEVRNLLSRGFSRDLKPMRSLGYSQMCSFLAGELSLEDAVNLIKRDTRRYSKRQMTWFRKDDEIKWFEYSSNIDIISNIVIEFYCKGAGYGKSTIQHSGPIS